MKKKPKIFAQYAKVKVIILLILIPTILIALKPFLTFKNIQLFYDDNWLQHSPDQVRDRLTSLEHKKLYTCISKTIASYNFFSKIENIKQKVTTNCLDIPELKLLIDKSLPLRLTITVPKIEIAFYVIIKNKDMTGIIISQQDDLYPIIVKSPPSEDIHELAKRNNIPIIYYRTIDVKNLPALDKIFILHKNLKQLPEFTPVQYIVMQTFDAPPTLIIHFKQFELYVNPHLTNKEIINKINQSIEVYKRLRQQTHIKIIDTRFDRITIK